MKRIIIVLLLMAVSSYGFSQIQNPVKWTFTSKKIASGKYEVHMVAVIDNGWHIYSKTTPEGGPVPTLISFNKNPLAQQDGTTKEVGKLEQHNEPLFGVDVKQFSNKVDFVQVVKIKGNAKTFITGTVEFMVCNNKQCLPPKAIPFSIALR